jgi:hypothetical protein
MQMLRFDALARSFGFIALVLEPERNASHASHREPADRAQQSASDGTRQSTTGCRGTGWNARACYRRQVDFRGALCKIARFSDVA